MAVNLNEKLDYFGTTVNVAARVQGAFKLTRLRPLRTSKTVQAAWAGSAV